MKIGAGGFVSEEKPQPKRLGQLGQPSRGVQGYRDDWKERNWMEARAALARKLHREGKTPAEIRKELAGYDAKRSGGRTEK